MIECTRSRIADLGQIIGINSFNVERCTELDPELFEDAEAEATDAPPAAGAPADAPADAPSKKRKKRHDLSMVSSCGIKLTGNFDVVKFNTFMGTLLQERAKDIYRSKGVLAFEGQGAQKFVFQGVHEQIDFGPAATEWGADEPRVNKLVFIGRNLDRASLEKSLTACLV